MADPTITLNQAPRRDAREGGLDETVATFIEDPRLAAATGIQYDPAVCAPAFAAIQLCYGADLGLGTNEVQTVTITGTPTGGTFRLTFDGEQTATIAHNANAATVQAALEALDNLDAGYVVVGGGPGPGTPYTVQFTGPLADRNVPQMTASHAFTGGTAPNIAVTTTTAGVAQKQAAWLPDAGVGIGPSFGGYLGVECWLGQTQDEYAPRARQALELAQGPVLEEKLWAWLVAGSGTSATSLAEAIALAETAADSGYVGRPVLHMNRGDVTRAKGSLEVIDGRLFTVNRSPVVASAKYAAGTVVASGGITVVQSPVEVNQGLNLTQNRFMAIAERVYNIAVDCAFRAEFTVS